MKKELVEFKGGPRCGERREIPTWFPHGDVTFVEFPEGQYQRVEERTKDGVIVFLYVTA